MDSLAKILDDAKGLSITEEEWEQAGRSTTPFKGDNGEEKVSLNWDNEKGPKKDLTLNDSTVDFIRSFIKDKDDKKELTVTDKDLIHLKEVLN